MEDERIVRLYLDRDENAIGESSAKYGPRLRALSLGITSDAQTAEECENDTRHISIDRCRQRANLKRSAYMVELSEELETCLPSPENVDDAIAEEELGKAISAYLKTVSAEKRVIFVRRYFYLDSVADICRRCSVSESKVKSTLFRTRSGLREYLIKEGYAL